MVCLDKRSLLEHCLYMSRESCLLELCLCMSREKLSSRALSVYV